VFAFAASEAAKISLGFGRRAGEIGSRCGHDLAKWVWVAAKLERVIIAHFGKNCMR
jgi:hypothetical protein